MSPLDHRLSCDHFPCLDRTDVHWTAHLAAIPPVVPASARVAVKRWSFHLPMRDGNRLAVDVHLPASHEPAGADHFAPLPGPAPELQVLRGPRFPSALRLPVQPAR